MKSILFLSLIAASSSSFSEEIMRKEYIGGTPYSTIKDVRLRKRIRQAIHKNIEESEGKKIGFKNFSYILGDAYIFSKGEEKSLGYTVTSYGVASNPTEDMQEAGCVLEIYRKKGSREFEVYRTDCEVGRPD